MIKSLRYSFDWGFFRVMKSNKYAERCSIQAWKTKDMAKLNMNHIRQNVIERKRETYVTFNNIDTY